jgi:hypothetical protein
MSLQGPQADALSCPLISQRSKASWLAALREALCQECVELLEPTQADKLCASLEPTRSIHLEKRDRRPPGGRQPHELAPAQHEMHRPDVPSWMEQRDDFARAGIDSGEIGSLVAVTSMACPCEVVDVRLATMLAGDDMLQVERLERR